MALVSLSLVTYYIYTSRKAEFLASITKFILALILGGIVSYFDIAKLLIRSKKSINFDKMWVNTK